MPNLTLQAILDANSLLAGSCSDVWWYGGVPASGLLKDFKLLSLPKLLDICAVYEHDNHELTSRLVTVSSLFLSLEESCFSSLLSYFFSVIEIRDYHLEFVGMVQGLQCF